MDAFATIVVGVLLAVATAFFTSRFYVHQAKADLKKELEQKFNERRWQGYTDFSNTVLEVIQATQDERLGRQSPKIVRRMQEFIRRLWLIGSDKVVQAVLDWRRTSQETDEFGPTSADGLVALANILIAMRHDLGDTDTKLTARDILATFINDIDKYVDEDGRARPSGLAN